MRWTFYGDVRPPARNSNSRKSDRQSCASAFCRPLQAVMSQALPPRWRAKIRSSGCNSGKVDRSEWPTGCGKEMLMRRGPSSTRTAGMRVRCGGSRSWCSPATPTILGETGGPSLLWLISMAKTFDWDRPEPSAGHLPGHHANHTGSSNSTAVPATKGRRAGSRSGRCVRLELRSIAVARSLRGRTASAKESANISTS
jgi:hypothetical protein